VAKARRVAASQTRAQTAAAVGEGQLVEAMLRALPRPAPPNRVELQIFLLRRRIRTVSLPRGATAIEAMLTFGRDQALSQLGLGVSFD
jgi:hypothetical protein